MLQRINLTSNRQFKIRNFEEDKIATLSANPGLRYDGKVSDFHRFSGNYYLTNSEDILIENFDIIIIISKAYPNTFPIVLSLDNKIEKRDDFHIDEKGVVCLEHTYIANKLASVGLRLYDFINYYLPKYFSWVLLKQKGITENLQEWEHKDKGTIQVYEALLNISDKGAIRDFLQSYLDVPKIGRNDKCYCNSGKKLKYCHYEATLFLKSTPRNSIAKDISLFNCP